MFTKFILRGTSALAILSLLLAGCSASSPFQTPATAPPVQVVGEAADGREAINLISELQPNTVLMDASMPVMDGLEATRSVKTQWPEARVIVLTIHTGLRAEALAAGADAFLVKGCPADELLAANLEC